MQSFVQKKSVYLVVLWLAFSCKEKLIDPPEKLIPQGQMTEIVYDLALINALKSTDPTKLEEYKIAPMSYVFGKYGIDSLQFVSSDQYYASLPAVYQAIYQTVQEKLEKESKELERQPKQKNDSVRAISKIVKDSVGSSSSVPPKDDAAAPEEK